MTKNKKQKSSLGKTLLAGLGLAAGAYFYSTNSDNKPIYSPSPVIRQISFEEANQRIEKILVSMDLAFKECKIERANA